MDAGEASKSCDIFWDGTPGSQGSQLVTPMLRTPFPALSRPIQFPSHSSPAVSVSASLRPRSPRDSAQAPNTKRHASSTGRWNCPRVFLVTASSPAGAGACRVLTSAFFGSPTLRRHAASRSGSEDSDQTAVFNPPQGLGSLEQVSQCRPRGSHRPQGSPGLD